VLKKVIEKLIAKMRNIDYETIQLRPIEETYSENNQESESVQDFIIKEALYN